MKEELFVTSLFRHPEASLAYEYLSGFDYPWEAFAGLADWIRAYGKTLDPAEFDHTSDEIWIAKGVKIAPTASIAGPCIIEKETELRPGAFLRGGVVIGKGCVIGNSTELKNCILFDGVQVPHFNYVGDSVLGYRAHMGAGAVTSNVKSDRSPVTVRVGAEKIETGRKKFGALLGDLAEIGCNSVLNPGTVIGVNSRVYPLSSVRGYLPPDSIYKTGGVTVPQLKNRPE